MSVLSTSNNELKYAGFDKNGELTFVPSHKLNLIHFPLFSENDGDDMLNQEESFFDDTKTTTENK